MGGSSSQTLAPAAAPVAPSVDNSQDALEAARKQQAQARGAAATILSNQQVVGSTATLMTPGSSQTKKLMLGQ